MALIAELLLVGMALHARILKTDDILLTLLIDILPVAVPEGLITPMIYELHVRGPHEMLVLNAFPFGLGHFLDFRRVHLRLGHRSGLARIHPECESKQAQKDSKPH